MRTDESTEAKSDDIVVFEILRHSACAECGEDGRYRGEFASHIRRLYPGCPESEAFEIAAHACLEHSGRVGRTADAKRFDPEMIALAARAHVRHVHTDYDRLLGSGWERHKARDRVVPKVDRLLESWSRG